jgi:hypothetical protein
MRNISEKSFTLVVLLRTSRQVLVVFLKETKKKDVRIIVSELLPGWARTFPKLDSMCISSSIRKVTEEVNYQFARRISHVATTTGHE